MANILNISDHGPFGGMTDQELERLACELMAQPEYRRKELAALLIHSTLNITQTSVEEIAANLMALGEIKEGIN
tara:strand:- start:845 stop:1066 length:222 start_codon:yes stop_codon:yes gene_type:complete